MTDKPWYAEDAGFFGPDYLLTYEDVLPQGRTVEQIDFIEKTLGLTSGVRILDIPCGHGRHSVELARRGHTVTGVDINSFFLEKAHETAVATNISLRLKKMDMREIQFKDEFDVALNLFTAIGYFDNDEDDQRILHNIFKALKKDGVFILDFLNANWIARNFKGKEWRELSDGSLLLEERTHDPIRGRNMDRRILVPRNGMPIELPKSQVRTYTPYELVCLGQKAGLSLMKAFGDFNGSPLTNQSRRVILFFKK